MTAQRMGRALAGVMALLALLHAYWAVGGTWGLAAALGGSTAPVPPLWAMWLVVGLLLAAGLVLLGRVGVWGRSLPHWVFVIGCWGLVVVLVLVALINILGRTWLERLGFAPFALLLAGAAAMVARAPKQPA